MKKQKALNVKFTKEELRSLSALLFAAIVDGKIKDRYSFNPDNSGDRY
jgi:hypothetical protein